MAALLMLAPVPAALAVSAVDLPAEPPISAVLDEADVISRSATAELERRLGDLDADGVRAVLITVRRLDYGLGLDQLAMDLVERWSPSLDAGQELLAVLIDAQNNTAAIAVSPALSDRLPGALLRSTAMATMGLPLRDGGRYRQAGLDALDRLAVVLAGQEDPGPPRAPEVPVVQSNVPSQEETSAGNALLWVVVLLVVGSIVPMITWWVFSR